MTIPTISTLPTAPARTDAPATFITRADAFLAALVTMQGELNTSIGAMNTDIAQVNTDATAAAASASAAASSATAAANAAGAALWVSGQAYAEGDAAISLVNYQTYRAETATSGTTDPSLDANWTAISGTFPVQTGNAGKYLSTNGTTPTWETLTTDPTLGTLTKTFTTGESSTINLTSSVLAPVVSVTKEVPQSGVTNNNWDVNSTTENYTRLDSASATSLSFATSLANASFVTSFSVSSQETIPEGLAFNTDGTKMYIVGTTGDDINEYTLSTGFDVSTASYSQNFSISAQDTAPQDVTFNADGTKMYMLGYVGGDVNEYSLSTAFDISTASYTTNFVVSSQESIATGMTFNTDGTKMFVCGFGSSSVHEYTLSTGFDISTASFVGSFSISGQEGNVTGVEFNSTGTLMFIVGYAGDEVNSYNLSTAYDISTSVYSETFSISSQDTNPTGIRLNTDNTKMFVVGSTGDAVYEYTLGKALALGTGSFASADVGKTIEANDGAFVLTATDGSYVETTAPTSYAQVASGSWEMYGVVYNAAGGDLELSATPLTKYDISNASYDAVSFSVAAQETAPTGLVFSNDGLKLFIVGRTGDDVNEYALSTAYDPSTATYTTNLSVSAQQTNPRGICFNADGTALYISGSGAATVSQYTLSTAFDLSTGSYASKQKAISEDTWPSGISFNSDGTILIVVGQTSDALYEYSLSTAYDISTASYTSTSFSVSSQDTSPSGLSFSNTGEEMFVVGTAGVDINKYSLSTAFDISTASYSTNFSVSAQESNPTNVTFNNDGSQMYVIGEASDTVYQYSSFNITTTTGYNAVHTTASIDSTYWTDINSMTADQAAGDGNVYYAISTDDRTTWTVVDDTDGERDIVRNNAGTWQYNSNGTYASETWANGATNTELATLAEAMAPLQGFQLSAAAQIYGFSIAAQETEPQGLFIKPDGTEIYISSGAGVGVDQYTLSSAYDLSSASHTAFYSTSAQGGNPREIFFSSDGTKMFECQASTQDIKQYTLSTAWDITTASFDSVNFVTSGQVTNIRGVCFNQAGTRMYVVGSGTSVVAQYDLGTAWSISTAVYNSVSFSFSAQAAAAESVFISSDGLTMLVGSGALYKYALSSSFDVSSAVYSESFDAGTAGFVGVNFSSDGTKLYYTQNGGTQADTIQEYSSTANVSLAANQMDKTQLDAVTDPNHIALGDDLDLAIIFNMTSGTTVPSSDGVAINYDANVLNKGAVLGTDYDFDAPAQNSARITALTSGNFKVRVL